MHNYCAATQQDRLQGICRHQTSLPVQCNSWWYCDGDIASDFGSPQTPSNYLNFYILHCLSYLHSGWT